MPGRLLILFIVWGWFFQGAAPNAFGARPVQVEVKLFQAHSQTSTMQFRGPAGLLMPTPKELPAGLYTVGTEGGALNLYRVDGSRRTFLLSARTIFVRSATSSPLTVVHPQAGARKYRGLIKFGSDDHRTVTVRNLVPTRDYIIAVLGSETLPRWSTESLKAQAVLTQSRLARYKRGDALDDTTQAEAYLGAAHERPEARSALQQVWGEVLAFKGQPVEPFYHSTCAGGTSDGGELFSGRKGAIPYATPVVCDFCRPSPFWKSTISNVSPAAFRKMQIRSLPIVVLKDGAGRPILLKLDDGKTQVAYDFWIRAGQELGWDKIPGTRFRFSKLADGSVEFQSTGAGHGVGLCQWGANEQARSGKTYRQILQYYFPLARVQKID